MSEAGGRRLKYIVEALLFASPLPLPTASLARAAGEEYNEAEVKRALLELGEEYDREGRGMVLRRAAGGYRLVSAPRYAEYVERLAPVSKKRPLTAAALETLAIVAYKQPVTRAKIDSIRGANSEGTLRTLLERRLVAPMGRSEEPGRPMLYGTTREFLLYFGLDSLDDLPREKDFPATAAGERQDEKEEG